MDARSPSPVSSLDETQQTLSSSNDVRSVDRTQDGGERGERHPPRRISWDDMFVGMAEIASLRSPCHRLHVGCVLVTPDNHIVAQGYNGFISGAPHISVVRDGHEQMTVHAEQNAIYDCARRGVSCYGCIAYVTHYPCIGCIKALCSVGVKQIKYVSDYHNDDLVPMMADQCQVTITQILPSLTITRQTNLT